MEEKKMIPNCVGCKEELNFAFEYAKKGLYLATSIDCPSSYPNVREHFCLMMVDDDGNIMVK